MTQMFSSPRPQPTQIVTIPAPPASPPPPADTAPAAAPVTREDPAVASAREKELELARKVKGRSSTILTGAMGDTSQPTLGRKTLLGG
ncbi:MAG TPA: hypothetical protein VEC14_10460 [Reyranellaceae bacterium]|nr:hypothetical protein [Reyranellaceae bacterium]